MHTTREDHSKSDSIHKHFDAVRVEAGEEIFTCQPRLMKAPEQQVCEGVAHKGRRQV